MADEAAETSEPEGAEAAPNSEADWGTDSNASGTEDTERAYEAEGLNRKQEPKFSSRNPGSLRSTNNDSLFHQVPLGHS